jgi:hypothetical protein
MTKRDIVLKDLDELGLTEADFVKSFPEIAHDHRVSPEEKPKAIGHCPACGADLISQGAQVACVRRAGCGYYETPGDRP